MLPVSMLLTLVTLGSSAAAEAPGAATAPPAASISGQLAFSDTIVFDYNRDGTPDRVQFWIELQGLQAIGTAADPGARAESGSVSYFVFDVERQQRIDNWLLGFNMGGGFPVAGEPYPITDISITGRTAQFKLTGSTWTITDNGDTWEKDSIEIETGGRRRQGRFYGGNVTVTPGPPAPPKSADLGIADAPSSGSTTDEGAGAAPVPPQLSQPASSEIGGRPRQNRIDGGFGLAAKPPRMAPPMDVAGNRKCNECHAAAAMTMAGGGGAHSELECVSCHTKYHGKPEDDWPLCLNCHNSHSESITMRMCRNCHSSHDVAAIRYDLKVPDVHCTACHKKSAARLRESGTRHAGLACVICHRSNHPTVPTCVDCHSGPHAPRVMKKPEGCVRCHESAHQTKVER
jgi:hypothetical protein